MKLVYHRDWRGNFGDDLNPLFFAAIHPTYENVLPEVDLFGIGTLLGGRAAHIKNAIIFGSGFGHGDPVTLDPVSTRILGVRGPVTAAQFGLPDNLVIGDPALHCPRIEGLLFGKDLAEGRTVVALHHRTAELWHLAGVNSDEFFFLDPALATVEDYIATISNAKLILAEAMHAAIMAVAFDVPFIPIAIRAPLHGTKWLDFTSSVGLEHKTAIRIPSPQMPIVQRLALSRANQVPVIGYLLRPTKVGATVTPAYIAKLASQLNDAMRSGERLRAPRSRLDALWPRFEAAVEKLKSLE